MKTRSLGVAAPILVGAVSLMAALFVACNGGDSGGTATPTTATPPIMSPVSRTATPTPLPSVEPTSYRFLYSEFGAEKDVIWSIDPADPSDRKRVAAIRHKSGWGVKPALSPDGGMIAYNAMPEQGLLASADAETHILDLKSGERRLVAQGVGLRTAPLWSPDAGLLFLRRDVGEDVTVILVDLTKPDEADEGVAGEGEAEDGQPPIRTVLRQHVSDVLTYIPLGFDREEAAMFFVQIQGGTESGTYLGRYAPATGEAVATATAVVEATATAVLEATATARAGTPSPSPPPTPTPEASPTPTSAPALIGSDFLFLSDQTAQSYSLSPDSSRLIFLVPSVAEGEFMFRTHIADIKGEKVSPLKAEGLPAGEHLRPIWHPDGDKVSVGQLPDDADPGRVATVPLGAGKATFLPPPEQGFDSPLSWSPDGKFLAVTSFPGESIGNPGRPRLVLVSAGGQRLLAPEGLEIEPIGWVKAG